ncbi:hypothetical protein ACFS07_29545 [Undibacterium arcticum]
MTQAPLSGLSNVAKFIKNCIAMLFFSAMTALVAALVSGPAIAQTQDIVIGQVAPLSGVLADTGREMVLGGQIYF